MIKPPDLINKLRELINKFIRDNLWQDNSIILALIIDTRKSQTRREAGTESHGTQGRRRVAEDGAIRFFVLKIEV